MSILIDESTRLLVQGITGREGQFHTEQMLAYGTKVVAGVTPGKGGEKVHGVPVYNTVRQAVEETGADATILFVPARHTFDGAREAIEAGVPLVIAIAEHVPVRDMLVLYSFARRRGVRLIGPNSFGVISPGKAKAGFMAHSIFRPGPVAFLSRSATNCYETVLLCSEAGIGQSTAVGVGGDMIPGSTFEDLLPLLEADPQTKGIVLIGEIGGDEEERAAACLRRHVSKPVVAMIAGRDAPPERTMGHAGAIVAADGTGSAAHKEEALRDAGAHIAECTEHIVEILQKIL